METLKTRTNEQKRTGGEKVHAPDWSNLRRNLAGKTSWNPSIRWEAGSGPDQLPYMYGVKMAGPKGVHHY